LTKIILFNGPPRSGKDTAALRVQKIFSSISADSRVDFDRFAMPLKAAFAGVVGADMDEYGNVEPYESTKGDIIPEFNCSYRQWQIDFSESYMKLKYGSDIFARLFVQRNRNTSATAIVVPDSGFKEEAKPIADAFGLENTLLIRCHRPGYDFTGDSRSYISGISPNEVDVHNDTTINEYYEKITIIVAEFLRKKG
jgi:hypothetical protein